MENQIIQTEKYLNELELKKNELIEIISARKEFYIAASEYELSAQLRECERELIKIFQDLKSFNDPYDLIAIKLSIKN